MREYPRSIEEGIKILDEVKPNWRSLIDTKKLDMSSMTLCPLGQLYGHYRDGLEIIFGDRWADSNSSFDNPYGRDKIHGDREAEWMNEIKNKQHDWNWARLRLKDGKKVRRANWDKHLYIKEGSKVFVWHNGDDVKFYLELVDAVNWELHEEPFTLSLVKCGQKFRFKDDWSLFKSDTVYQRITQPANYQQIAFIEVETGTLCAPFDSKNQVVILERN